MRSKGESLSAGGVARTVAPSQGIRAPVPDSQGFWGGATPWPLSAIVTGGMTAKAWALSGSAPVGSWTGRADAPSIRHASCPKAHRCVKEKAHERQRDFAKGRTLLGSDRQTPRHGDRRGAG